MKYFDTEVRNGQNMLNFKYRLLRFCFLILCICIGVLSSCVVCVERDDLCQMRFNIHLKDKTTKECFTDFNTIIDKYGGGKSLCVYQLKDSVQINRVGKCIENFEYSDENICFELNYNQFVFSGYSKRTSTFFIGTDSVMGDTIIFVQNGTEMEILINGVLDQKLSVPCSDEKNAVKTHLVELYIEK